MKITRFQRDIYLTRIVLLFPETKIPGYQGH